MTEKEWLVIRRIPTDDFDSKKKRSAQDGVGPTASGVAENRREGLGIVLPDGVHELRRELGDVPEVSKDEVRAEPIPLRCIEPIDPSPNAVTARITSDHDVGLTWGLRALGIEKGKHSGAGARVAIIDTGIDRDHAAFAHLRPDRLVERDFTHVPGGECPAGGIGDSTGHGTHCAAIIAGGEIEGISLGVAPQIEMLFVAKAIGGPRGAIALLEALSWAEQNKADVVSMSLGFDFVEFRDRLVNRPIKPVPGPAATSQALAAYRDNIRVFDAYMSYVAQRPGGYDPLIFAASGNSSDHPNYAVDKESPAAAEGVLSVGAVDDQHRIAPFSNINPDFVGPGIEVVSAKAGGGIKVLSGTSMACPHIAGLAALYLSALRASGQRTSSKRVERALRNSAADRLLQGQIFAYFGEGMPGAPGA